MTATVLVSKVIENTGTLTLHERIRVGKEAKKLLNFVRALNRSESNQVSKCTFSAKLPLFFSLEIESDFLSPI